MVFTFVLSGGPAFGADTCVFMVEDDVAKPRIGLLLDSGTSMQHVVWHEDFDNTASFAGEPTGVYPTNDIVYNNNQSGSGFFNQYDYAIENVSGTYYLVPIGEDMLPISFSCKKSRPTISSKPKKKDSTTTTTTTTGDSTTTTTTTISDSTYSGSCNAIAADASDTKKLYGQWTINGRTIILPAEPGAFQGIWRGSGMVRRRLILYSSACIGQLSWLWSGQMCIRL
jgi:hypothetical protein